MEPGTPKDQESLDSDTTNDDEVVKVWYKTGTSVVIKSQNRLDKDGVRRQPSLVSLKARKDSNTVLERKKTLKAVGGVLEKFFVRKNTHPAVRAEAIKGCEGEKKA